VSLKLYVWRGGDVLRRVTPGIVTVIAPSQDAAWARLKLEAPAVWAALHAGQGYVTDPREWGGDPISADEMLADALECSGRAPLSAPQPEVFELDAAPVLAQWGGE
jgi:hypothetical protein